MAVIPTKVTTSTTICVAIDAPASRSRKVSFGGCLVWWVAALVLLTSRTIAGAADADQPGSDLLPAPRPVVRFERDPSGDGFRLGRTTWLAGDATVVGLVPEHGAARAELDDISLLLRYEPTPRLSLFSETRLENTVSLEEGRGLRAGSGELSIERLYAEILLTPHLELRVGKVLTPFGLWNVIRRAPLSWTVERPIITEHAFPQHVTGLSLHFQETWRGWSFDATGYGPAQDELAFRGSDERGLIVGGRTAVGHTAGSAFVTLALDAATFEEPLTRRWTQSSGADAEVDVRGHQITGEFAYEQGGAIAGARSYGLYVQDAFPLIANLYGVVRFEQFQPRIGSSTAAGLLGVSWRPARSIIVKVDYQFMTRPVGDVTPGLLAAVSLFF